MTLGSVGWAYLERTTLTVADTGVAQRCRGHSIGKSCEHWKSMLDGRRECNSFRSIFDPRENAPPSQCGKIVTLSLSRLDEAWRGRRRGRGAEEVIPRPSIHPRPLHLRRRHRSFEKHKGGAEREREMSMSSSARLSEGGSSRGFETVRFDGE